jgi:hypothetical protein
MRHLAIVAAILIGSVGTAAQAADRQRCDDVRRTVQPQLDAACPCASAKNRAAYSRCIADKLRELSACHKDSEGTQTCGPVPRICLFSFRRTASRSSCGEPDAVTCCVPRQHDCLNDPTPGDGKQEGTCSRSHKPCDTLRDCRIPTCRLATSADRCKHAGGTVGSGKDCSTACTP